MTQKIISIKKVLKGSLGKLKAEKYLKVLESEKIKASAASDPMNIYQMALSQLYEGETEKALNLIVFGLDNDRENRLILHLCKTMLYGLTQFLAENDAEKYKQKYSGKLEAEIPKQKKKIKDLEKIVKNEEEELEKLQKSMMKHKMNFIVFFFKKGKFKRQVQELKTTISNYIHELEQFKTELNKIEEIIQKDECIKVVGLIIEVCVFPNRFGSDMTKTGYI